MMLKTRTASALSNNLSRYLLALSLSFLVSQPLVAFYFFRMPEAGYTTWWVRPASLSNAETSVAIVAAFVIFVLAQPLERRFGNRGISAMAAGFSYLGILATLGIFILAAMTPLIALFHLEGALIYLPATVGVAALVSAPVAFIARWLYPSIACRISLARWVTWVGISLISISLLGSILFQIIAHLTL